MARYHFFLSYAHAAPLRPDAPPDTDHWVSVLFDDLSREVAAILGTDRSAPVGWYDDAIRPGSQWKSQVAAVLGAADVFVALYSPAYFAKSWPLRERAAYMQRFGGLRPAGADAVRLLPVLWVPLPAWQHAEERAAALGLGAGIPEYAENGLRALCRLAAYESQYREVVRRLGRRIVDVVRTVGPRPGGAVLLDEVNHEDNEPTELPLTVVVLTSTAPPEAWQPYGGSPPFLVTEYTANIAERLGLPARVVDAQHVHPALVKGPVLVLVDPWMAETARGRETLSTVAQRIPEWATLVSISDRHDPRYADRGSALRDVLADELGGAGERRVRHILQVDQLVRLMPTLIDDAYRQFLAVSPAFLPKGPQPSLPRIADRHPGDPARGEHADD